MSREPKDPRDIRLSAFTHGTVEGQAWFAWRAARYHFEQILALSGELAERVDQGLLEIRTAHERAFRWEIVSARDILKKDPRYREAAESLDGLIWFRAVKNHRNFTHEGVAAVQYACLEDSDGVLAAQQLPAVRGQQMGDDRALFETHLRMMHDFLIETLTPRQPQP